MEVNTSADRCADWAAKRGEDREWHETDHTGLLYENVDEEEGWYRPGGQAKNVARQHSAEMELGRRTESITSEWLLQVDQGRGFLGE
eukprot:3269084-Rhodomonas_salina.1